MREDVGFGDPDGGEAVGRLREGAGARARRDSRRAEGRVVHGRDRPVILVAELHAVPRVGAVARREMLLLSIELHEDGLADFFASFAAKTP